MRFADMKGALPHRKNPETVRPPKQLTTAWGEALDPAHVREEYPRPRLVRERYAVLNGYWQYAVTKGPERPARFDGRILVPFSPESALSGVGRQLQPDEYLWYERTVPVPEHGEGERCLLHFGAVDQSAAVFVNGAEAVRHTGGYLPFTADLTLPAEAREFTLTVRVRDLSDTSFHSRGKQKLQAGGMYYTAQSGIWQSVWTEVVPRRYLEDVRVETRSLQADAAVLQVFPRLNRAEGEEDGSRPPVLLKIFAPTLALNADRTDRYDRVEPILVVRADGAPFTLRLPDPRLWTPETPWLYPAEIRVGRDRAYTYFAVRTFAVGTGRNGVPQVLLNGQPVFLNGVLNQGYWPDGLYTAPADEAFVYDIAQMKELGFNMMRMHAKIEDARWYYHCDRLGMLVWQDMVNGGGDYSALLLTYLPTGLCVPGPLMRREVRTKPAPRGPSPAERIERRITARTDPEGRAEFRRECAETIDLLRGSPCVMTWVLFNEGWGQFGTEELTAAVRRKDSVHLIDSASGWFEHKTGDFKSVHNYFRTLRVPRDVRANVLSEYGGYVYHIDEHSMAESTYGYHTCTSAGEFEAAFLHLMTEELLPLREQGLCGAVYTQVSDIEEETNGLLTWDRRVRKISEVGARRLREAFR